VKKFSVFLAILFCSLCMSLAFVSCDDGSTGGGGSGTATLTIIVINDSNLSVTNILVYDSYDFKWDEPDPAFKYNSGTISLAPGQTFGPIKVTGMKIDNTFEYPCAFQVDYIFEENSYIDPETGNLVHSGGGSFQRGAKPGDTITLNITR
jgi:hypothetical protein